jgi:hypothetical protein
VTRALDSAIDLSAVAGPMLDPLTRALAAASSAHVIADDAPLVRVEVDDTIGAPGRYDGTDEGIPMRIAVHPNSVRPGLTLLHETAHYLDHAAIGVPGQWASTGESFDEWRMRVDETDAAAALHSLQAKPPLPQLTRSFDYFLRIHELFARSYAQWVAIRSSDETLLDQVSQSLSTLHYPEYWELTILTLLPMPWIGYSWS